MTALPPTLFHLLRERVDSRLAVGFRFLEEGDPDGPTTCWNWRELDRRARMIAGRLQALGYAGERALMLFPPGLDFVAGFFGCVYAGVIAVPAYPPDPTRLASTLPRLQSIVRDARPALLLTTSMIEALAGGLGSLAPELAVLESVAVDAADSTWSDDWRPPALVGDDLAFLQYTSGSTGSPKGVMVSHANLLANQRMIAAAYRVDEPSCVSWLPPFHDMGLIGTILGPIYQDGPATLFSPLDFLKRPLRWMQAISRFRGTISGAPDFAYALCARKATPADVAALDLRCWRLAFSGAEPVRVETLRNFSRVFADAGFSARSFFPTFGLAEATLLVTGGYGDGATSVACEPAALERGRVVAGGSREVAGCGTPALDTEVAILRADGSPADADEVGEIAVRGPGVACGYWDRPTESAEVFAWRSSDGRTWLRTGDLGFLYEGALHVTGRSKDLIILRGRNHYPQDIEATVTSAHVGIRPGCVAAFAIPTTTGAEGLGLVAEVQPGAEPTAIATAIRDAVARTHELRVDSVTLIPAQTLAKTSSGKLQRQATRQAWLEGRLSPIHQVGEAMAASGGLPRWLVDHLIREAQVPREQITREVSLQNLGLDSLAMVQFAGAIEEQIGVEAPVEMIFGRTLGQIADWVDHTGLPTTGIERPDLEAAAAPARDIVVADRSPDGDTIVLTGATGLLGSYLLAELLARSGRAIVCLVRATDPTQGRARIAETALRLGLTIDLDRVEVLPADLAAPRLGLTQEAFTALARRAWRIVHCGARIDWSVRFEELRPTNVDGTIELARLAALGGGVAIHHVSSLGVYPLGLSGRGAFDEDEAVREGERLRVPYFQSKWAAERALEHARARGIPVSVYRPGFITGDSRTGAELATEGQLFAAFIAGVVRLGSVPAVDKVLDVVPVDFVAAAIAALALRDDPADRRFNLQNPQPLQQSALYALLRERGYPLAPLAYTRWRDQILRLPREDPESPLARFALYYRTVTPQVMRRLEAMMATRLPIDDRQTRADLERLGIVCPPFDARLVGTYLAAYAARGLLPERRVEVAEVRSPHAPTLLPLDVLAAPWLAGLSESEALLTRLYDQAKRRQWDANTRLDWSLELDPDNPHAMPDESIPIWGSPVWKSLGDGDRREVRRHYQGWQLSQFLAGEQGALLCAARVVQSAPNASARLFCATQVVDEARHVELFARLLHEKVGVSHPISPPLQKLLDDVLLHASWDVTCLGMQVLIEGLGLAVFSMLRDRSQHPLIAAAHAYVTQDEARHVSFGKIQLAALYRELSARELAEREEFVVEASYLLRDRFAARDLWEQLGLPAERCVAWIEDSGTMRHYRGELFRRIVPVVRAIGLWGPRVRDAYAKMGILDFADVEIDALIANDERVAEEFGAHLRSL